MTNTTFKLTPTETHEIWLREIKIKQRGAYAYWKHDGSFLPHVFNSQVRETEMFRLMPKVSALVAVQRHTAASTSAKPWVSEKQGNVGEEATTTFTNPSKSAHTPTFRVSLGEDAGWQW